MSKSITIELDADTDKLELKLRVIAKHAKALADDLEWIDKIDNENEKVVKVEI